MKFHIFIFVILTSLLLSLCSCTETSPDTSNTSGTSGSDSSNLYVEESSLHTELIDEKLDISAFSLTTDKTEYNLNDTINLTLTVDSEYQFLYGEDCYIEYFDSEWKKCDIEYVIPEIVCNGEKTAVINVKLSERADKGREKYRAVQEVRMSYDTETVFTVYSNEFFINAE
ncbi:MAG: hypothetical protein IJC20_01410 [Clostridia bacterium]|nr:hypothetical protein [Clostridia bacterium]